MQLHYDGNHCAAPSAITIPLPSRVPFRNHPRLHKPLVPLLPAFHDRFLLSLASSLWRLRLSVSVMPPPPVDSLDEVMANAEHPRKHTASPTDDLRVAKRTRTSSFLSPPTAGTDPADYKAVKYPTSAELARAGLRRSITLALDQVGFDSASEEAMESFSSIVETCKHIDTILRP